MRYDKPERQENFSQHLPQKQQCSCVCVRYLRNKLLLYFL